MRTPGNQGQNWDQEFDLFERLTIPPSVSMELVLQGSEGDIDFTRFWDRPFRFDRPGYEDVVSIGCSCKR